MEKVELECQLKMKDMMTRGEHEKIMLEAKVQKLESALRLIGQ
jgi:hypothetical protein